MSLLMECRPAQALMAEMIKMAKMAKIAKMAKMASATTLLEAIYDAVKSFYSKAATTDRYGSAAKLPRQLGFGSTAKPPRHSRSGSAALPPHLIM